MLSYATFCRETQPPVSRASDNNADKNLWCEYISWVPACDRVFLQASSKRVSGHTAIERRVNQCHSPENGSQRMSHQPNNISDATQAVALAQVNGPRHVGQGNWP